MNNWLKENVGPMLALVTVIGTFALFGLAFFLKVDGANEKVPIFVIGALIKRVHFTSGVANHKVRIK